MKAFVTGATGFLGTHLVKALERDGWEIIALHRRSSDLRELRKCRRVTLVEGDVLDRAALLRGMPEGVDAVFHAAASVANMPHRLEHTRYAVNQDGTRNIVEASLEKKALRFVYTSTVLTYDFRAARRPFNEDAPPNDWCRDAYIQSKRLADIEVEKGAAAGLDAVFLHPSAMFGAYDKQTWSKMFLEVERGLPLPFAPPAGGSVCHAAPVAEAHVAAYRLGARNRHYILGGPDVTWLEVMREVSALLERPAPVAALPVPVFKLYGWTEFGISSLLRREPMLTPHAIATLSERVYSDSSRAVRELGYRPSSLREMLRDCHRWMIETGMLARASRVPGALEAS